MMMFTIAFSLETLLFNRQIWMRISVGVALATMIFLVSWCVWTAATAKPDSRIPSKVHLMKGYLVDFTTGLPGRILKPGLDVGSGGGGDGQGNRGEKFLRSGTLKEAFNFTRGLRRQRAPASSKLPDAMWTGRNGLSDALGSAGVEIGSDERDARNAV